MSAALALVMLSAASGVVAQTSWNTPLGGDWQDGTRWSAGVPNGTLNAVIDVTSVGPTLEVAGTTSDIFIGRSVLGRLTIQDGGTLASSTGYLAFQPGSSGTVVLTDADTSWSLKNLYVGGSETTDGGTAALSISSGSAVDVDQEFRIWTNATLSIDGGSLEVRDFIDSGGSVSHVDGLIAVRGGTFRYRIGDDFKLDSGVAGKSSDWLLDDLANTPQFKSLVVEHGTLTLSGGTEVTTTGGTSLGNGDSSPSGIVVQGSGTSLTVNDQLSMSGGTLTLSGGAALSANSVGTSNDVTIDVTGGSFSVTNDFVSADRLDLTVSGANFSSDGFRVAEGLLSFNGSGQTVKWEASGTVRLGHAVLDENEFVSAFVGGMDVEMQELVVGDLGDGNIGIFGGGTWSATNVILGNEAVGFFSTGNHFSAGHLATTGNVTLGALDSSEGRVEIRLNGSTAQIGGDLILGDAGKAVYEISRSGSTDVTGNVWIGVSSTERNSLELEPDSRMTIGGDLVVGQAGRGVLEVISSDDGGATLETISVFIALEEGSEGSAVLQGRDASWTDSGSFSVGTNGDALLTVSDGALLETGSSSIGTLAPSEGEVQVTGSSTRWFTASLEVARSGGAVLLIDSGAQVQSSSADIAAEPGSIGSVTVEGLNSGWTISNELHIGGESDGPGGEGTLRIEEGATVTAGSTIIHADGRLTGNGGQLLSDVVSSGEVAPGASPGILTIDGDFTLLSGGTLNLEIDGPLAGSGYDQLLVSGALDLTDGTILLDFSEYTAAKAGDLFQFFPGQDLTGQSLNLTTLGLGPNLGIDSTTFAATGTFALVPEPTALALLLAAGFLILVWSHLRRRGSVKKT